MDIEFTKEEKRIILLTARDDQGAQAWGYYGAVLLPILFFGVWGMVHEQPGATNVAFLSAFGFHLFQIWYASRFKQVWQDICRKISDRWIPQTPEPTK